MLIYAIKLHKVTKLVLASFAYLHCKVCVESWVFLYCIPVYIGKISH